MSEIYLTKIERKTIFTKSLIFVLIMFIISDLTVTGPFYFNFIPWLYILGVLGSIKNIDSILMSVIGTFTVFVSSLIAKGGINLDCILSTVITLGVLILGIVTGKLIYEFILEHRLVKYIKPSKKVAYIVSIILMLIVSLVAIGAHYGNIISYLSSRANLTEYITKTYGNKEFSIESAKYITQVQGKYVYTVNIDGQEVYFVPVTKTIFKDANLTERLEVLNNELAYELDKKTAEVLSNFPVLAGVNVKYNFEYTDVGIKPDTIAMYIDCNCDEKNLDSVYSELSHFIKQIQTVKQTQKVVVNINEKSLQIIGDNISKVDKEYLKGGFEIEEVSE